MHRYTWILGLGLVVLSCSAALASSDYVVIKGKINPVMAPKSPPDPIKECARDPACAALAQAGATYLGVPPGATSAALAILSGGKRADSEDGFYDVKLPVDYTYCRSQIHMISVVPADGQRASVFGATSTPNGVSVYTWTPKQGVFKGRSWVDADITVYGVRTALAKAAQASGRCRVPGRVLESCRGNGTGDRPACKSVDD